MNLRRKKPHDSLYMLLDTMCNAFGGIILLAVMVVLLTSKEKSATGPTSDSQEMLERRLALAQTNLQQSLQLATSLQAKAASGLWKQQVALLSTRKDLQGALVQTREAVAQSGRELETASASDPADRLKFLNAQLAATQVHKLEVQNGLAAATEAITHLKQRLAALKSQVSAKYAESMRQLRLPKEYQTGKRVIYVIARYGRIYVCRNSDLSRNESDITWTSILGDETAEPIRGKGIDPVLNHRELESYFNSQSRNTVYIAFCVFEDSFPAFVRAKQSALTNGIAYGWEPFRNQDGPVTFTENGHKPKPQ
jgi:hypothetical protein